MICTKLIRHSRLFAGVAAVALSASSAQATLMNTAPGAIAATALSETVVEGESTVSASVNAPSEGNAQLIDGDLGTKFLSFAGFANDNDASDTGIIFFFPRPVTVQEIRFGIANDAPERDPASYTLEGSNSVDPADYGFDPGFFTGLSFGPAGDLGAWTPIVGGSAGPAGRTGIAEPTDTFLDAFASRETFTDESPFNRSPTAFTNNTAYSAYRLLFPDLRLPNNGIIQLSEVELLAPDAVPEPTSIALMIGGCLAAFGARRRVA